MEMISIFIIGAQKAGTSTLKRYLGEHESVVMHHTNEFGYFVEPGVQSFADAFRDCYPSAREGVVAAKNVGILMRPGAIDRLREHNPRMRLIVTLRDPVARAFSAFLHARREGLEARTNFGEAVFNTMRTGNDFIDRKVAYLENGIYHRQLDQVYEFFPSEQVLVLKFEDLVSRPEDTVARMWAFCGLDRRPFAVGAPENAVAGARSGFIAWLISERSPYKKAMRILMPRSVARGAREANPRMEQESVRRAPGHRRRSTYQADGLLSAP